eukprot:1063069-Alexandrium_andersonii.AAC.1
MQTGDAPEHACTEARHQRVSFLAGKIPKQCPVDHIPDEQPDWEIRIGLRPRASYALKRLITVTNLFEAVVYGVNRDPDTLGFFG